MQATRPCRTPIGRGRRLVLAVLAALPLILIASPGPGVPTLAAGAAKPKVPVLHESTPSTIGSSDSVLGYTFASSMTELPADQQYQFRILRPDGKPQMDYLYDQTKFLHFLAVRNDFTNFAHVHPTLAGDGTWSVHLPLDAPGPYQLYVDTLIKDVDGEPQHLVLRRQLTVPGSYQLSPVGPAPSLSGTADGYTITFNANKITTMDGTHLTKPKGWTVMYFPATITYQGKPMTDLQPYLSVFAHFTAFNVSNELYGHAHPLEYAGSGREGWPLSTMPVFHGGPVLTFHAEFPGAGDYRTFVEFMAGGQLHTVSLTLHVE
jgi:hypothetical protein